MSTDSNPADGVDIAAIFETVNETFTTEMLAKQTKLNAIEASVRHATRALADKRQQVALAQAALGEVEQVKQKSDNVRNALSSIAEGDWTGCAPLSSESASGTVPAAFRAPVSGSAEGTGEEIALPSRGEEGALLRLRRMMIWEDRIAATLQDRIDSLQGQGADKAVQYRRLVSLCTKVPVEKVDGVCPEFPFRSASPRIVQGETRTHDHRCSTTSQLLSNQTAIRSISAGLATL